MRHKILLDTDIGSDIDDAVCLAYLLVNPDCDLVGITTVTGEGEKRAQMASALCQIAKKDVPIHIGAETPLLIDQRQPNAPQAIALGNLERQVGFPLGNAVSFMRRVIRENPGQITLLSIGPLTNIALLFKTDPEIPSLLKGLVMMCGAFEMDQLEWNAMLDPHASEIVYRTAVQIHRSVGLDVTGQVTLPAVEVRQRFQDPLLKPVIDFAEIWFEHTDILTFHDPLAATTIFDDEICRFTKGQVNIELDVQGAQGKTYWKTNPDGPHDVALTVKPEKFFKHFFSLFGN
jgi:inosine-uridine nucleoside N-ribohydrolase